MPNVVEREYEKALESLAEGNDAAAELCCRRLVKAAPNDPRTIEIRAELALLRDHRSTARGLFEQLLDQPEILYVLIGLCRIADIHSLERQFDAALEAHRKVVTLAKEAGENFHLLISLHQIAVIKTELGHLR